MFTTPIARVRVLSAALSAVAVLGACGGSSPAESEGAEAGSSTTSIEVVNIAYAPETLEVGIGDKVEWTSKDEGVHHTVTSGTPGDNGVPGVSEGKPPKPDGVFDGDLPDASSTFTFTFDKAGTYAYFCEVHPSMVGEVIVR